MSDKILIVDDDPLMRKMLSAALKGSGYDVTAVEDANKALQIIDVKPIDLALLDIVMPDFDGLELQQLLKKKREDLIFIMMTGFPKIETSVQAIKGGAYDYITKPFSIDEVRFSIKKALEYRNTLKENSQLKKQLNNKNNSVELIGDSPKIQEIFRIVESVRDTDCTVLIEGESGTGKEVLARTIHNYSKRSNKPFIAINCGALPDNLLESELFGHEKGAFTGAVTSKKGLFEAGNGGTVFLDEIAETSPSLQVRLLRVLEERTCRRIGSTKTIELDFRLLAASNKKLLSEVKQGKFREDLYYRLNLISLTMPPLRERKQDIPLFVEHFVDRFNNKHSRMITGISNEALEFLKMHEFPGNVRELANIVERAVILSKNKIIQKELMPILIGKNGKESKEGIYKLDIAEKNHIQKVLEDTNNQKSKAAELLGVDRKTLYLKIKKYGLI